MSFISDLFDSMNDAELAVTAHMILKKLDERKKNPSIQDAMKLVREYFNDHYVVWLWKLSVSQQTSNVV